MKSNKNRNIIDATAGLGYDSFILASLGAKVTLIERSVKMYKILQNGFNEGVSFGGEIEKIINRMELLFGDSKDLLPKLSPEVIMIDTMYTDRKKTALAKNNMRLVREIVGPDSDYIDLIEVALSCAKNRVVLKQPRYADPIREIRKCSHQILGKTVRYDIFMTN